jgi:uncharacterized protein involved in response to NO
MGAVPRLRAYAGPAFLSYGFRPFFLLAALHAGLAVPLWLAVFDGELAFATAYSPRDWHIHEMIYGFVPAVMAGFLLTAIPNWTGRLPLQGAPLLVLVLAWLAGRAAVAASAAIGWAPAAAIDIVFLVLLLAAVIREIVAGRNWSNLKVAIPVALLTIGNIAFHVETSDGGAADCSVRLGLAAAVILVMVIGGRIIPSFTRNWLMRANPGRLPAPFGRFDVAALAAAILALAFWVATPAGSWTGPALIAAGLMQAVRLARWAGDRTLADRLVLVLHMGYAFVPAGFLLLGGALLGWGAPGGGLHAWAVGAIGTMTLAVMTRASLGHTGQPLAASPATQAIYAAILLAAFTRILAALAPGWSDALLPVASAAWMAAFLGFAAAYGPALCRTKPAPAH